jgi:hypothetical protein
VVCGEPARGLTVTCRCVAERGGVTDPETLAVTMVLITWPSAAYHVIRGDQPAQHTSRVWIAATLPCTVALIARVGSPLAAAT